MRKFLFALFLFNSAVTYSQIKLPRLISNGMILQRDTRVKLWGWASPGEKVSLTFQQKQYQTKASANGKWTISLPPQKAGGPYDMQFTASNAVTVKDILFGDVWLCSGQSNMELPMDRVKYKYASLIPTINNPLIRQFEVPDTYNFQHPNEDVPAGQWIPATQGNILRFSAVAYFFANELYQSYHVPIGLINAALGGAPAEAWISEEALKAFPAYFQEAQRFKSDSLIAQIEASDRTMQNNWYGLLNRKDLGLQNHWVSVSYNDHNWQQMNIPGYWADQVLGNTNGAVWFRREVTIPKAVAEQPAEILLGCIVDADSVFINGRFVGTTSYQYPPRRYSIPTGVLQEGQNVITIRVINSSGKGGFVPDKPYQIITPTATIDLKGPWKYQLGATMEPLPAQTFVRWKPLGLYNAMIAPLTNYSIKGALWYQGESNTKAPSEYTALMTTLIKDWRQQWHQGNFPFLLVQLPNFMEPRPEPTQSNWAELRQAQLQTLMVPHTGMAVTIDLGEWNDIHPLNKQDVGKRLALQARQIAYGQKNLTASGPLYQSIKRKGNQLVISFSQIGSGLVAKDNKPLQQFAIAGPDGKFVWATAQIQGNKVVVRNDAITNPVAVRYAWADNPEGANLYNKEGLPASPFEARIK